MTGDINDLIDKEFGGNNAGDGSSPNDTLSGKLTENEQNFLKSNGVDITTSNVNGNGKDRKQIKSTKNIIKVQSGEKTKHQYTSYKYSNRGKGTLHEAVIIAGVPVFLKYENGELKTVDYIEESSRIIKPPCQEEYPYETYDFTNMQEVIECENKAKAEGIDSLYQNAKSIVKKYNDQEYLKAIQQRIHISQITCILKTAI